MPILPPSLPLHVPTIIAHDADYFLDNIDFWLTTREDRQGTQHYLTIRNNTDRPIYQFTLSGLRPSHSTATNQRYFGISFDITLPVMPGETSPPQRAPRARNVCGGEVEFSSLHFSIYEGDGVVTQYRYDLLRGTFETRARTLDVHTAGDLTVLVTADELEFVYTWEGSFGQLAVTNNSNYAIRIRGIYAVDVSESTRYEFGFPQAVQHDEQYTVQQPGETGFLRTRPMLWYTSDGPGPMQAENLSIREIRFIVIMGEYRDDSRDVSMFYCFMLNHYRVSGIPVMPPMDDY